MSSFALLGIVREGPKLVVSLCLARKRPSVHGSFVHLQTCFACTANDILDIETNICYQAQSKQSLVAPMMPHHPYFTEEQLVERFGTLDKEGRDLYDHAMKDFQDKNAEGLLKLFNRLMGAHEEEDHRRTAQRWLKHDEDRFRNMIYCQIISRGPENPVRA